VEGYNGPQRVRMGMKTDLRSPAAYPQLSVESPEEKIGNYL